MASDPADLAVGGQALLEGVMMRAGDRWGAAARRPDGVIVTTGDEVPTWARAADGIPLVRGALAMVETIMVGLRALKWSAQVADPESDTERSGAGAGKSLATVSNRSLALTTAVALAGFAAVFAVIPAAVARAFDLHGAAFVVAEAGVRLGLFGAYLVLMGRSPGIQRTFAYHGAEHMTIAAHEHRVGRGGDETAPMNVARVRPFSTRHARCGTDFLLLVVVVAIVVFSFVGDASWAVLVASRVVGLPIVAGLAYEVLKLAKRRPESRVVKVLTAPGLALQALTTRVPTDDQIEVAIAALAVVLEPARSD